MVCVKELFGQQQRVESTGPEFVAGVIEVEVVGIEQVSAGLAGGIERDLPEVNKGSAGVLVAEGLDALIGSDDVFAVLPALDAGFDGEEQNFAAVGE